MIENHKYDSRQVRLEKQLRLAGMTDEKEIHELSEYIVGLEYKIDKLNDMLNSLSQPKDNWVPDYKIHKGYKMKDYKSIIAILVSLSFGFYSTVIRFQNPSLTETELFLKIIGF